MLKLPANLKNKKGQAMIEFIPIMVVLMILVFTSLVFFQGIRESIKSQEASRNLAFATIANSGPIVSGGGSTTIPGQYEFAGAANRPEVSNRNMCFGVRPQGRSSNTALPSILGMNMQMSRVHKMSVFRQPGPKNSCD